MRDHPRRSRLIPLLALLGALAPLWACGTSPRPAERDIPLPEIAGPEAVKPLEGVYALIRRIDVPLNEPTDDAWAVIDEQSIPALTRGAWRGNGIRLGLLDTAQRDAYAAAMPQPVYFGETLINQSPYRVPVFAGPRLRADLRLDVDLTIPPMPQQIERLAGGRNSNLQILARIETEVDGTHTLVLTPHHRIPQPLGLTARDPLERELDGRVFDELTVRINLGPDTMAVVGLYWPWPLVEQLPPDTEPSQPSPVSGPGVPLVLSSQNAGDDPAAPPPHIRQSDPPQTGGASSGEGPADTPEEPDPAAADPTPRLTRTAPILPVNFGSTLFTGTRIRQPVKTVLLISIHGPEDGTNGREHSD